MPWAIGCRAPNYSNKNPSAHPMLSPSIEDRRLRFCLIIRAWIFWWIWLLIFGVYNVMSTTRHWMHRRSVVKFIRKSKFSRFILPLWQCDTVLTWVSHYSPSPNHNKSSFALSRSRKCGLWNMSNQATVGLAQGDDSGLNSGNGTILYAVREMTFQFH